jgi:spore maturation protein SpmA
MLNRIWVGFFVIAYVAAFYQYGVLGNTQVFEQIITSIFTMSKTAVDIAIGLIGLMCFWLGMMKIAESAGLVAAIARVLSPGAPWRIIFYRQFSGFGNPAILAASFAGLPGKSCNK